MKIHILSLSLPLTLLVAGASSLAAQTTLERPAAGDLAAGAAVSRANLFSLPGVAREPVSFTYPLAADQALTPNAPHQAISREYWVEVDGRQLRQGVDLYTTAPGALIRINPAGATQLSGRAAEQAIDPLALELQANGRRYPAGQGMDLLVDAEQLRAANAPFLEGTSAFRVADALGVGQIRLALPTQLDAAARFVIHVFEPKSPFALRLQANAADLLDGQALEVQATVGDSRAIAMSRVEAMVTSPSGKAWPMRFVADKDGNYRGSIQLDAAAGAGAGLWEVQWVGRGQRDGLTVVRGGRTAFNYAVPTATLTGRLTVDRAAGLGLRLPVQVGTAGRYEVRGVLHGTDAQGVSRPLAIGHFANWLAAGEGSLTLSFDRALLEASGLRAPYVLHDLRLMDQSRMGLLHRQELAVIVP